jgi:hypothetical protein
LKASRTAAYASKRTSSGASPFSIRWRLGCELLVGKGLELRLERGDVLGLFLELL